MTGVYFKEIFLAALSEVTRRSGRFTLQVSYRSLCLVVRLRLDPIAKVDRLEMRTRSPFDTLRQYVVHELEEHGETIVLPHRMQSPEAWDPQFPNQEHTLLTVLGSFGTHPYTANENGGSFFGQHDTLLRFPPTVLQSHRMLNKKLVTLHLLFLMA